jgi:superfamily I DNA and/or RNA helicase
VSFYRDPQSEKLLNVAISRAKDELIIIGNSQMIASLGRGSHFWQLLQERIGRDIEIMEIEEVCDGLKQYGGCDEFPKDGGRRSETALYSHGNASGVG